MSKTQLSKIIQLAGFLGRLLGPLLRTALPLVKSVIQPLAKSVLNPLGLTAAASAADAGIFLGISDSGLLLGISETIKNEAKEQKERFLSMLLGTLGASLLGNMLAGKGVIGAGEGTVRAGYGSKKPSLKKMF